MYWENFFSVPYLKFSLYEYSLESLKLQKQIYKYLCYESYLLWRKCIYDVWYIRNGVDLFLYRQVSCCGHTQRPGALCRVSVPMVTSCSVLRMTDSSDVTTKRYVLVTRSYWCMYMEIVLVGNKIILMYMEIVHVGNKIKLMYRYMEIVLLLDNSTFNKTCNNSTAISFELLNFKNVHLFFNFV